MEASVEYICLNTLKFDKKNIYYVYGVNRVNSVQTGITQLLKYLATALRTVVRFYRHLIHTNFGTHRVGADDFSREQIGRNVKVISQLCIGLVPKWVMCGALSRRCVELYLGFPKRFHGVALRHRSSIIFCLAFATKNCKNLRITVAVTVCRSSIYNYRTAVIFINFDIRGFYRSLSTHSSFG